VDTDAAKAFALIGPDLEEVRDQVARELRLEGAVPLGLVGRELASFGASLPPALVILSARPYHYRPQVVKALACVFQFIYLATRIHCFPQGRPGLPVLVGDLLYSKFFFYLCRYNCLEFLAPLAQVICRIHEGGALRYGRPDWGFPECLEVVDRQAALLFQEACRVGARVAGASSGEAETLGRYGFNLGRAWGLYELGIVPEARREFLLRAEQELSALPPQRECEALLKLSRTVGALVVATR
jgi:hypothetical protein